MSTLLVTLVCGHVCTNYGGLLLTTDKHKYGSCNSKMAFIVELKISGYLKYTAFLEFFFEIKSQGQQFSTGALDYFHKVQTPISAPITSKWYFLSERW